MDSSKRHWPSMFKSKSTSHGHQWQHDISSSLISTTTTTNSHQRPSTLNSVTEEIRTPDPKPRWNPRPEQIRILESIFNSGMVNPPRDEIRRIRGQLQEYGQVGDANVFYWFQNRKSRSKNKKYNFQNSTTKSQSRRTLSSPLATANTTTAPLSYPSSPTFSVNQPYFCTPSDQLLPEPYFIPGNQSTLVGGTTAGAALGTRGLCFHDNNVSQYHDHSSFGKCSTSLLLTDLNNYYKREMTTATPISAQTILIPSVSDPTINHIQGAGEVLKKSTVFINDVAIEVASGPFDVREAFGEDAVLIHSSGHPVVTNEWGVTLHSLQHGALYYLVRMISTPQPQSQSHSSIHLI